jgi:mevalonate kinase
VEKHRSYANGKLLITGEYLVLQGALALAVPTIPGQEMIVSEGLKDRILHWKSYYHDQCWFEAEFSLPGMEVIKTRDEKSAAFLQRLLGHAIELNPGLLENEIALKVETRLGFRQTWGLGSSSSLISNLADWFKIDPYKLFRKIQAGSGYDIACATSDSPLRYRLVLGSPVIQKVSFNPAFSDQLAFVYAGRKQDSAASVNEYLKTKNVSEVIKAGISHISRDISSAGTMSEFNALLEEHEDIMSTVLDRPKIKSDRFPDFPGSIKSLGAWGGDFMLASSEIGYDEIKSYFSERDLNVIFAFEELIRVGEQQAIGVK